MKQLLLYGLLGLLAFVGLLIAKTPANFVTERFQDVLPATVSGVEGSIWQGRAAQLSYADTQLQDLRWQLHPLSLLTGRMRADIDLIDGPITGQGQVKMALDRSLQITETRLRIPAREITFPDLTADFTGELFVRIEHLELANAAAPWPRGDGPVPAIQAQVVWQQAGISAPLQLALGQFLLELADRDGEIRGDLSSPEGPLETQGNIRIQKTGAYDLVLRLHPRDDAPDDLRQMLELLGRPDRSGAVTLRQSGNIKQFF